MSRHTCASRIILLFFVSGLLCSCADRSGRATPDGPGLSRESVEMSRQREIIRRLTDEVLLNLARRDYRRLTSLIEPTESVRSGRGIAVKLLGAKASSVILGRWDAQRIEVVFEDDFLRAIARVEVSVRLGPNHRARIIPFSFRFHRSSVSAVWRLYVR